MKYLALAAPAILALAACGANSANFGGADTDFDELVNEAIALTGRLDDPTLDATETLPLGSAEYNGVAVIANDFATAEEGIIGDVEMSVDFSASSLSGNVDSFYSTPIDGGVPQDSGTGMAVPGALALNVGPGDLDTGFFMDVTGNITLEGQGQSVDGQLMSGFLGVAGEIIVGEGTLNGSLTDPFMVLTATSD